MALELRHKIIAGKLKLINDKTEEGSMNLEKDDWKPDLSRCQYGKYPHPNDLAAMAEQANRLEEDEWVENRKRAKGLALQIRECSDGEELEDLHARWYAMAEDVRDGISIVQGLSAVLNKPKFEMPAKFG